MSVAEIEAREVVSLEPGGGGLWRDASARLRRDKGALVGFALVGLFVLVAIFAPLLAPEDPRFQDLSRLGGTCCPGPSLDHWFGIDALGRDELSRIIYGARYSLLIGVVSVAVGLSVGMIFGSIAGYVGGAVDSVIMRLTDIMLAIPGLLLAVGIVAMLGPGIFQIMVAVGVTQIPIFTRLMRGSILAQRDNDFVLAARSIGVPRRAILSSHILPNAISPVIVQGTLALATAIIDVAALGWLGLGPQDPSTPASIIESPRTRSMNRSPSPVKSAGSGRSSSTFCCASTSAPAATSPTRGTWRTGRRSSAAPELGSHRTSMARGLAGSRRRNPIFWRVARCVCTVDGEVRPDGLADLADRRRIAPVTHVRLDDLEDLALASGQGDLGHRSAPSGERMYEREYPRGSRATNTCSKHLRSP